MSDEWILGNPARARPFMDAELEVWLDDGAVRRARLTRETQPYLRFLDCWHPLQNCILNPERIQAWRMADLR